MTAPLVDPQDEPDDEGAGRGPAGRQPEGEPDRPRAWTRRRLLAGGLAGVACAALAGLELVDRGVLPGKAELDRLDGACSVSSPPETLGPVGPSESGSFFSKARQRNVGYTIAYPPGHRPGSRLALVVALHGYLGSHASALGGVTLAEALAERPAGGGLPPMALVAADGGDGYWNPHPGDDPLGMLVDELIPMCQGRGLGGAPQRIGTIGISMGGYGSLLIAERHPSLIAGVAAISPAVWTTYAQAHAANAGAFASATSFAENDVVTHASALGGIPVRVASGRDDPFRPGVEKLGRALPSSAVVQITKGCHDASFFASQRAASLAFLGQHLA